MGTSRPGSLYEPDEVMWALRAVLSASISLCLGEGQQVS